MVIFARVCICFLLICLTCLNSALSDSVLNSGKWYKLAFEKGGICKLDAAFLRSLGYDVSKQDLKQLRIFGFEAGMLPQSNDALRTKDLIEIPLYKSIKTQGKTEEGDYILFYVQDPHPWVFDTASRVFFHQNNLYSDSIFYFLNWAEGDSSKNLETQSDLRNPNTIFTKFYQKLQFHEKDLYNILESGREWYGESFESKNSYEIAFTSNYYRSDLPTRTKVSLMVQSKIAGITRFTINQEQVNLGSITSVNPGECRFCFVGKDYVQTYITENTPASTLTYNILYDKGADMSGKAYINYLEVMSHHDAIYEGNTFHMTNTNARLNNSPGYIIRSLSSALMVWDVTNPLEYKNQQLFQAGNEYSFGYQDNMGNKIFVVFDLRSTNFLKPTHSKLIPNQNIQSTANVDFIIITHQTLRPEAERLANRRNAENIRTRVVTTDEIYNEYSGGRQDITAIRDFLRNVYFTNTGLKNVLLFGACSYDYKNRISSNTNLVPTYQSRESLHDIFSYNSEDYYTFFASGTGNWIENESGNHKMEIGIGRIPASTLMEAKYAVDKLFHYKSVRTLGKWRNRILFSSDNGDANLHLRDADAVAEKVDSTLPQLNIQKIYISALPLVSTPSGNRAVAATAAMLEEIRKGVLLFNYSGHGGVEVLAQETFLDIPTIMAMRNLDRLPFYVTATCDFGAYDDPKRFSGSKAILLNPNGGGIGLITAVRPVFTNTNYALNLSFYNNLLSKNEAGSINNLGTVFKNTKNGSINRSNRAFALIGDPSLTLNFPKYEVKIENIYNGRTGKTADTIMALSIASITGVVINNDNQVDTAFNGFVEIELFDKKQTLTTLEQEGTPSATYELRNNILYAGINRVMSGRFSLSFVVPKNINYSIGTGKLSAYAYDPTQLYDAAGEYSKFKVGLSDPNALDDTTPPEIVVFMNDSTFVNGQKIHPNSTLVVYLKDENGINISKASIGQDIRATLNQDAATGWTLNDYYLSDIDTYKSGVVRFPMQNLPEGRHTLQVKAWDTYNNASEAEIEFTVLSSNEFTIEKLWNTPNPVYNNTLFKAIHNRGGEELDVQIDLFDAAGALLYTYTGKTKSAASILEVDWDFLYDKTYTLRPGLYVYRLTLTSKKDQKRASASQRLVLTH